MTPEEMKKELTVVVEVENEENDDDGGETEEQPDEETRPESQKSSKEEIDDAKSTGAEENDENDEDVDNENGEGEEAEEEVHEETTEVSDENENDDSEDDDDNDNGGDNVSDQQETSDVTNDDDVKSEINSEGIVSKPPSRQSVVKQHRLDSAISTCVGKSTEADNKSIHSTTSRRTMRSRSKSESSIPIRRGSLNATSTPASRGSTRERRSSTAGDQASRKPSVTKSVFNPKREPEFYSTVGCSLKLSQIRMKQRLLYIMWRVVYDQAVKKMKAENQRKMAERRQAKKGVKKSIPVISK